MSKYTEEELQQMAKTVLSNTGTMEYMAFLRLMSFYTGLHIEQVVDKIKNLASCGKEECN